MSTPPPAKRPYRRPALTTFGRLTELTMAGSAGNAEGNSSAPNKQRP